MGMEMAHEIEGAFNIEIAESVLMNVTDMPSLIKCVHNAVTAAGENTSTEA